MRFRHKVAAAAGAAGSMLAPGCSPAPAPAAYRGSTTVAPLHPLTPADEATTTTEPATTTTAAPVTTVTIANMPATTRRAPATTVTTFAVPERVDEDVSDVEWLIRQTFPETPDKAVRVARCESGLDPGAVSPGGGNVGLMQINVVHKGLAASLGYSWGQMLQAGPNLAVARAVYDRAGGWGPWSCA